MKSLPGRWNHFSRRLILSAALFAAAFSFAACATAPPRRVSLDEVIQQPRTYENERVELTGLVQDYKPAQGDTYRTLVFRLGRPGSEILAVGAGYTAEAIAKASLLVEEAFEQQEPLTVVGKLKLPKTAPPELRLETVRYKGREIKITGGPRTRPGFSIGGAYVTGSIGIGATITP